MPELNFSNAWLALVVGWTIKILVALAIFAVGYWLSGKLRDLLESKLTKREVEPMLSRFLSRVVFYVLMGLILLVALDRVGIQMTAFIAVIGAAGLAIGLALQGTLSNFAAGIVLILKRPFKKGDYIEAAGTSGLVEELHMFHSILRTPDNCELTVPNSLITDAPIKNYSRLDKRRIDLLIGVGYGENLKRVTEVIKDIIAADSRILSDPEPFVGVAELADSAVNLYVRPWAKASDWWATRCDLLQTIKTRFDEEGIEIPFPQRTVHQLPPKGD